MKHKSNITTSEDGRIQTMILAAQFTTTKKSTHGWDQIAAIRESCRWCGGSSTDVLPANVATGPPPPNI